jgi:L-rhamnose mutarotase
MPLSEYTKSELRFRSLARTNPAEAERLAAAAQLAVNQRWQEFMGRLFEPVPDKQNGERFAMLKEVFYLE